MMANDLTANPWFIDTPGATILWNAYMRISAITWTDQAAAGDQVIIKDQNGKVILDQKVNGANAYTTWGGIGWVNGLQVPTLGSGKLMIYVSKT